VKLSPGKDEGFGAGVALVATENDGGFGRFATG
jgi:hypothetical protein